MSVTEPAPDLPDWMRSLAPFTSARLVLVGIGRHDSGDDALGPLVVSLLRGRTSLALFDAGTAPENFVGPIVRARPDLILLVDAVHFSAPPGSIRLLGPSELDETDFTTHAMSPRLVLDFLLERTGAQSRVLAVQPQTSGPGLLLSEPVREAARSIADFLARTFPA